MGDGGAHTRVSSGVVASTPARGHQGRSAGLLDLSLHLEDSHTLSDPGLGVDQSRC